MFYVKKLYNFAQALKVSGLNCSLMLKQVKLIRLIRAFGATLKALLYLSSDFCAYEM